MFVDELVLKNEGLKNNNNVPFSSRLLTIGLPLDVTMEEIKEHFGKCGIIATDPLTQQPKIKLYK